MARETDLTALALVIVFHITLTCREITYYSKDTNIKCQSLVDIGKHSKVKCAVMCAQYRTLTGSPCKAFNVSNSVCTLCLNGPTSRKKQVTWSSVKQVYAVALKNYNEELEKGEKCSVGSYDKSQKKKS